MTLRFAWIFVVCLSSGCAGAKCKGPPAATPEARAEAVAASPADQVAEAAPSEPAHAEGTSEEKALPARCTLPFEPGPCKAAFSVYWFDPERRVCEPRIYGGCAGNDNRFDDLESCEATCLRGGQ